MVIKASNNLYLKILLWSLLMVFLFCVISIVFNHSLVNSGSIVVEEGYRINPGIFSSGSYLMGGAEQVLKKVTSELKNTLEEADKYQVNEKIYRNFFVLTFKWITFSSIFIALANHTYYHNPLFKKIRLINGNKKAYGLIPYFYSGGIFTVSFFFAFSLCFITVFGYDKYFWTANFVYWKMFVSILIGILFSTSLYVFLAAVCVKRSILVFMIIVFNFMVPFISTFLSFSSKNGYLYTLIFSGFDATSILISMLKSAWTPGYEHISSATMDRTSLEFFQLIKKIINKDETSFENWWLIFPLTWSVIFLLGGIKSVFLKREKYN